MTSLALNLERLIRRVRLQLVVRRGICLLLGHREEFLRSGLECGRCCARDGEPAFHNAGYLMRSIWAVQRFFDDLKREDDGLSF
jgi:hypothetical protein